MRVTCLRFAFGNCPGTGRSAPIRHSAMTRDLDSYSPDPRRYPSHRHRPPHSRHHTHRPRDSHSCPPSNRPHRMVWALYCCWDALYAAAATVAALAALWWPVLVVFRREWAIGVSVVCWGTDGAPENSPESGRWLCSDARSRVGLRLAVAAVCVGCLRFWGRVGRRNERTGQSSIEHTRTHTSPQHMHANISQTREREWKIHRGDRVRKQNSEKSVVGYMGEGKCYRRDEGDLWTWTLLVITKPHDDEP